MQTQTINQPTIGCIDGWMNGESGRRCNFISFPIENNRCALSISTYPHIHNQTQSNTTHTAATATAWHDGAFLASRVVAAVYKRRSVHFVQSLSRPLFMMRGYRSNFTEFLIFENGGTLHSRALPIIDRHQDVTFVPRARPALRIDGVLARWWQIQFFQFFFFKFAIKYSCKSTLRRPVRQLLWWLLKISSVLCVVGAWPIDDICQANPIHVYMLTAQVTSSRTLIECFFSSYLLSRAFCGADGVGKTYITILQFLDFPIIQTGIERQSNRMVREKRRRWSEESIGVVVVCVSRQTDGICRTSASTAGQDKTIEVKNIEENIKWRTYWIDCIWSLKCIANLSIQNDYIVETSFCIHWHCAVWIVGDYEQHRGQTVAELLICRNISVVCCHHTWLCWTQKCRTDEELQVSIEQYNGFICLFCVWWEAHGLK